ncbi:MAG: hypothetical protein PHU95_01205 [Candidatus Thermoplasmatota archaeon]|nr:hypothetical protein [Candidatus Thermoplasmatota archaeon]
MLGKKILPFVIVVALVVPAGMATYYSGTRSTVKETPSIADRGEEATDMGLALSERMRSLPADCGEGVAAAPLADQVMVIVDIMRLRSMTVSGPPQFYLQIFIDGEYALWWEEVYEGTDIYFEWPMAAAELAFDEEDSIIPIQIQVWQKRPGLDRACDVSGAASPLLAGKTVTVFYDMRRGEWTGDDYLGDANGYGHTSGFEDGDEDENDCELWFDIYQMEEGDSWWGEFDRLTSWEKEHVYGLNASRNYCNVDFNGDGIPIDWEDKYGFDPFAENSQADEDPDEDGLTNYEEYRTSQWLSDPFAQDIFIEVDGMQPRHPWGDPYIFPKQSQQIMLNPFARRNITVHIDDGTMGGGGDLIPFDEGMDGNELIAARLKYFLNGDENYWRRGVFHYSVICHQMEWSGRPAGGRMCYVDMHTIGGQYVRNWAPLFYMQGSDYYTAFASVFMHELGHTLGLGSFEGIDNEKSRFPWNKEYWQWGPYESCMNYRYVYKLVDYSDGDDEDYDQNDWEVIDLTRFTRPGW